MKTIEKNIEEIYKSFSAVTKISFKYGTVLLLTLFALAICFFLKSQTTGEIADSIMFDDLMKSINECMGSIYVLPMLYEIIRLLNNSH